MNRSLFTLPALCLLVPGCLPTDTPDTETSEPSVWYADADGDGYGDIDAPTAASERPEGHAAEAGDCDDTDPTVHPAAAEICDDKDNDCDGDDVAAGMVSELVDGVWTDVSSDLTTLVGFHMESDGELLLCEGTWPADIYVDRSLVLRGRGDVVLTGEESHEIAHVISTGHLVVEGVSLVDAGGVGAGLLVMGGTLEISDATIAGFEEVKVITAHEAEVLLDGVTVRDNADANAVMELWHGTDATFADSLIADNTAYRYVVDVFDDSSLELRRTWLDGNAGEETLVIWDAHLHCADPNWNGAGVRNDLSQDAAVSVRSVGGASSSMLWNRCDAENNAKELIFGGAAPESELTLTGENTNILCTMTTSGTVDCGHQGA